MITKWYEVTCDFCSSTIDYYILKRPTKQELSNDGVVVVGNKLFCCEKCYQDWKITKLNGILSSSSS